MNQKPLLQKIPFPYMATTTHGTKQRLTIIKTAHLKKIRTFPSVNCDLDK